MGAEGQLEQLTSSTVPAHANGNGRGHEAALGDLTTLAVAPGLLHEYFEAAVRRWPDEIAIDVPPGPERPQRTWVTYAELARQVEAIAAHLRLFIHGECVIAILLPRNSELLYATQLAVLKAGAAYLCIEPAFPDERIHTLLADSGTAALLTDPAGRARTRAAIDPGRIFDAGALAIRDIDASVRAERPDWLTPESLAYVIYTSGTTGTPKGTLIEHRSIANLVGSDVEAFGLGPGDRVAQNSSSVYDSSVEEIWLALAAGATLVVMDDDAVRLGPDVVEWLRRERITVFCPAPTMLRTTGCRDPETALPDLRLVYVGGEALPLDLADRWARGRRLENGYGPTECAVTAIRTRIHEGDEISIGVPIRGISAWILNDALEEVADGERGELCLGGIGLARGYHRRVELTAEKFPVHPVLGRIYRTGDLAHRLPDGTFFFHGRIDSQVKVRGHRVELEEIEARLAQCEGVREAACRVQGEAAAQVIVAFVVPERADAPPDAERLREALGRVLPSHMVPTRIGVLEALPRTTGNKLDRRGLPVLAGSNGANGANSANGTTAASGEPEVAPMPRVAPCSPEEVRIVAAFTEVFGGARSVSARDDFFLDLGGDSLTAAVAVSLLRDHAETAALTVRDLYDHRTAERLAACARDLSTRADGGNGAGGDRVHGNGANGNGANGNRANGNGVHGHGTQRRGGVTARGDAETTTEVPLARPTGAALFQGAWLLKDLLLASLVAYAVVFHVLPAVFARLGVALTLVVLPPLALAGLAVYAVVAVAYAAWVKRRVIGRYEAVRVPVWGRYYLRHWVVQRAAGLIPWWLLEGTEYQKMALRALGARIGRRVHLHRGVDLRDGGWDLLTIGDDVTLAQSSAIRLIELESREMLLGPITLGDRCTLDIQSGVGTHTVVEAEAFLAAHSSLPRGGRIPRGERWDGIPARPAGAAPAAPPAAGRALSPVAAGNVLLLARAALVAFLALPAQGLAYAFWRLHGAALAAPGAGAAAWLEWRVVVTMCAMAVVAVPLTMVMKALACRFMGRVHEGVVSRWSVAYVPIWLKAGLVDTASRWLYGTLLWPSWLRLAGARVGAGCEISSLIDALPETIEVGSRTFCADGIYLGGARVHRGSVTVERVSLGSHVFLGNGAVIPGGMRVPEETLLGIDTVAEPEAMRPGSAWFGHPLFELPRRQVISADDRLTEHPSAVRYLSRVFWELLRFSLPVVPVLALLLYVGAIGRAQRAWPWPLTVFVAAPLAFLGALLLPVLAAVATKWILLGRVKPGVRPLWSCWNSRWDFFCMVWNLYVCDVSATLRGTPFLVALLRAAGVRVGRGVVLGGRFAEDLPDPDMLTIEDGATVDCLFQAHTFEDRVLKNDHVIVRRGATVGHNAVLLYGADVGAGTRVAPHSVVMKHEHLLPGRSYEGFPIRLAPRPRSISPAA